MLTFYLKSDMKLNIDFKNKPPVKKLILIKLFKHQPTKN